MVAISFSIKKRKAATPAAAAGPRRAKKPMTPRAAIAWFLHDMAEASGYAVREWTEGRILSQYAEHRPMLTAPDPWYYAGVVALESCKIIDLFERDVAEELMRQMLAQMDSVVGRFNDDCSSLALLLMGRLGKGALLLHRKVPDNLLAKIMLILLGSPSAAARQMPDPGAHKQLRAALKLGSPAWWKIFARRYDIKIAGRPEKTPVLVPSVFAEPAEEGPDVAGEGIIPVQAQTRQSHLVLKEILAAALAETPGTEDAPQEEAHAAGST
jgi:hypothetical protein